MNEIIERAYYDLGGFNSIASHLKDARKLNPTVTMISNSGEIKNIDQKKILKVVIVLLINQKLNIKWILHFFDMNDDKYIGALRMIDIFSKCAAVVPFKTKQPDEILECIKKGIHRMGGKPKMFYTDNEGSFNSKIVENIFLIIILSI